MIRIKKISIQNFKGIKPRTVFDFNGEKTSVSILAGPNGFGKTTVFDVIEVCLTGIFKRIDLFDGVQKKNYNKNKPFFQNTDGEDVILKLWLEDLTTSTNYIIIKHYDDDIAPLKINEGRQNIPNDGAKMFTTYLVTNEVYFNSDDFSGLQPANGSQINSLFFGANSNTDLASSYYLFNYIQQEDSIYFLRKNEDEKGASLGFLFNIEKEELEKQKISEIRTYLQEQNAKIEQQILSIKETLPSAGENVYIRLFSEKEFDFDKEFPFQQLSSSREALTRYETVLNDLIAFKTSFSTSEYDKSLKYKRLNEEVLGTDTILNALLFSTIYKPDLVGNLEVINAKINLATEFNKKSDTEFIEKIYFDGFLNSEEEIKAYHNLEGKIKEIDKELGELGSLLVELSNNQNKILDTFTQIKSSHTTHLSEKNCPLCDSLFDSFEDLKQSVYSKNKKILEFNASKVAERTILVEQLGNFHRKILVNTMEFIRVNAATDLEVLAIIRDYPNAFEKLDSLIQDFPSLNSKEINELKFAKAPSLINDIVNKKRQIGNYIEQVLLKELVYNESLISNKHFYTEYFSSSAALFAEITTNSLREKITYLRTGYITLANDRLQFLEDRKGKLTKLMEKTGEVMNRIHPTIQKHKADMIEKIKIPFYIYSGKILQSYQQGLGIFVEINPTGNANNVRFKTGHQSDHDIVYHLSSGQMAVVSLAFCLSLNKVYNTNHNFKFLSIDDPIQTMDDLNVHTFIELVRNEFSDYQMIFSTHDDLTSRYMKYKFDKFDMTTKIQNIQKVVLDQSLS